MLGLLVTYFKTSFYKPFIVIIFHWWLFLLIKYSNSQHWKREYLKLNILVFAVLLKGIFFDLTWWFVYVGMGEVGESRARERTGSEDRADSAGEAGAASPPIRPQGSYEGDMAKREPETCLTGASRTHGADTVDQTGLVSSHISYEASHFILCLIFFSFWQTLVANCSTVFQTTNCFILNVCVPFWMI